MLQGVWKHTIFQTEIHAFPSVFEHRVSLNTKMKEVRLNWMRKQNRSEMYLVFRKQQVALYVNNDLIFVQISGHVFN